MIKQFTLATGIMICMGAQADPTVSITQGSVGGNDAFIFNIDPNGSVYDTINLTLTSTNGSFVNTETNPVVTNFTGDFVSADTDILGLNTVAVGLQYLGTADDENQLAGAVANLAGPLGSLDIAQAVVAGQGINGGLYQFEFALAGQQVGGSVQGEFGTVPEPGSLALLGLGGLALLRRRRR